MGLGILFIGYFITFGSLFFTTYLFADLIGCAVMIGAFIMLCHYNRAFRFPAAATGVLAFVYAAAAAMRMMGYSTPAEGESVLLGEKIYLCIQEYAITSASLAFYVCLFYAISKLAREVGLDAISKRCRTYMIVFGVYSAVWLLFTLISDKVAAASVRVYNVTASGLVLFNGVWFIMVMLLIMSCMKWIAPAEVLEAEERGEEGDKSLLTRIGIKLDKIQKRAQTPREDRETEKLRLELDHNEKLSDKNDGDK